MIAKEIQRDQLWKTIHTYILQRPSHMIRLYYKCKEDSFEGLPVIFEQNDHRLPRLLIEEKAIKKARTLPEPFKREFTRMASKSEIISLGLACSKYFGPLCRPSRANQTYNPYNELHFKIEEIKPIFLDIETLFFYGKYIRFEGLAALYFGKILEGATPITLEEEKPVYSPIAHFPLNFILFGPPGTGKTYYSVSYAVAIIEGKTIEQIETEDRMVVRQRYEQYCENGQIEFITFHQSYAYEEFVQGLRPDANRNTDSLHFRLADGIFKKIADRAKANFIAYQQNKSQPNMPLELLLDRLLIDRMNRETEEIELPLADHQGQFKSMIIYEVDDTYLKYKRRSLRDNVKEEERLLYIHKLKEKYYGHEVRDAINKQYYETVVAAIKKFEQQIKSAGEDKHLKNYVLIIDEINRANISRVFGELITLLEEDKRYGRENALTVTLPSGESFSVPSNLYIIGTMNTADKSIALLDIALRRRFEFINMYPRYDLVPQVAPMLQAMNDKIRDKKGADFMIGHSYFINKSVEDLASIFNRKIIPLLYEYFNNRPDQIKEVLRSTGLTIAEENYQIIVK